MSVKQDKALAELYLARSEGKIIQTVDAVCRWHDKVEGDILYYGNRIKPQTVEDAASDHFNSNVDENFIEFFKAGAQWQKEQDQ